MCQTQLRYLYVAIYWKSRQVNVKQQHLYPHKPPPRINSKTFARTTELTC